MVATPEPATEPRKPRRWTDGDDDALRLHHGAGITLNAAARLMDRDSSSVSKRARALGLRWDTTQTAAANTARRDTLAQRRTRIIERLYDVAEVNLDRLEAAAGTGAKFRTVMKASFGEEKVRTIDVVPPQDAKALVQSIGTALASAAKLEAVDAGSSEHVRSVLSELGRALGVETPDREGDGPGADTPA